MKGLKEIPIVLIRKQQFYTFKTHAEADNGLEKNWREQARLGSMPDGSSAYFIGKWNEYKVYREPMPSWY